MNYYKENIREYFLSKPFVGDNNMYYYNFKIFNHANGKEYKGFYCTTKLDDNFIGENSILNEDIKELGSDNFSKYYVEFYKNYDELLKKSNSLNEVYFNSPYTYNDKEIEIETFVENAISEINEFIEDDNIFLKQMNATQIKILKKILVRRTDLRYQFKRYKDAKNHKWHCFTISKSGEVEINRYFIESYEDYVKNFENNCIFCGRGKTINENHRRFKKKKR